jgi:tripartite-type tricarboxylate transporter receptor subunit TctC
MKKHWQQLSAYGVSVCLLAINGCAFAQGAYPAKPLRLVVGSTPGGGPDITARILAPRLSEALGQPVVVENRTGAGTMIATEFVAKSPPDGYTLLMAGGAHVANAALHAKITYHPLNDFAPVTQVVSLPFVLIVHASLPARSVKELVALARSKPGEIQYGSSGTGTPPHMSMELFMSMTQTRMLHVPYKGNSQAMVDVLAGHIATMMQSAPAAVPHLKAGRLRALGVTSRTRASILPDIPSIAEAGIGGYESIQWYGVLAPAGTPGAIVMRLQNELAKILQTTEIRERLLADGAEPLGSSSDQFSVFIRGEFNKWDRLVKSAGIKAD